MLSNREGECVGKVSRSCGRRHRQSRVTGTAEAGLKAQLLCWVRSNQKASSKLGEERRFLLQQQMDIKTFGKRHNVDHKTSEAIKLQTGTAHRGHLMRHFMLSIIKLRWRAEKLNSQKIKLVCSQDKHAWNSGRVLVTLEWAWEWLIRKDGY